MKNVVEREMILNSRGPLMFIYLSNEEVRPEPITVGNSEAGNFLVKLQEVIMEHILLALESANGHISGPSGAAALLGLNPNTLRSKMQKLNINFKKASKSNQY